MNLTKNNAAGGHPQHAGNCIAVVERNLGGANELKVSRCRVVVGERASALEGNGAMAPDGELEADDLVGGAEGGVDVAGLLSEQIRLRAELVIEGAKGPSGIEQGLELFDVNDNGVGTIFCPICVGREDDGYRFADIPHSLLSKDALPIREHLLSAHHAEVDRIDLPDISSGPDRRGPQESRALRRSRRPVARHEPHAIAQHACGAGWPC